MIYRKPNETEMRYLLEEKTYLHQPSFLRSIL